MQHLLRNWQKKHKDTLLFNVINVNGDKYVWFCLFIPHPLKFCWNPFSRFFITLLANKQTHQTTHGSLLGGIIIRSQHQIDLKIPPRPSSGDITRHYSNTFVSLICIWNTTGPGLGGRTSSRLYFYIIIGLCPLNSCMQEKKWPDCTRATGSRSSDAGVTLEVPFKDIRCPVRDGLAPNWCSNALTFMILWTYSEAFLFSEATSRTSEWIESSLQTFLCPV